MMTSDFQVCAWRLYLLLPLLLTLSATAHTCCVHDPHTLSELLLHDATNRKIFQCQVLESFVDADGSCLSRAKVKDVFKGRVDSAEVWLATGVMNSSIGCHRLQLGAHWLVFSTEHKPGWFGAGICDGFSTTATRYENRYETYLPIVTDFRDKTATGYSGPIRWFNKNGNPLAEGQMKRGKATGRWKHYNWEGKLVSTAHYRKGLLHGERNRADPTYLHREICRFQHGKLVERELIRG